MTTTGRYTAGGFIEELGRRFPTMRGAVTFTEARRTVLVRSVDEHALHAIELVAGRAGLKAERVDGPIDGGLVIRGFAS